MSLHDWLRALQHFPLGVVAAWATLQNIALGLGMLSSVLIYEGFNDWRKGDHSYKDVLGIVQGFYVASIVLILVDML